MENPDSDVGILKRQPSLYKEQIRLRSFVGSSQVKITLHTISIYCLENSLLPHVCWLVKEIYSYSVFIPTA